MEGNSDEFDELEESDLEYDLNRDGLLGEIESLILLLSIVLLISGFWLSVLLSVDFLSLEQTSVKVEFSAVSLELSIDVLACFWDI